MRLTRIALQKTFYGLVLGAYCFGLLTKPGTRLPKLVAARMLKNPYRMYGVMTGTNFHGISNFPKYTFPQVREALIELVKQGALPAHHVLKYEVGYMPDDATLKLAEQYLDGKVLPEKKSTLYVPYVSSGLLPTPPQHTSEHTLKSIANMDRLRKEARFDRFESRRLAAIQYQQGLIESLEAELDARRAQLASMMASQDSPAQLPLPFENHPGPFLTEGSVPDTVNLSPALALGAMPEVVDESPHGAKDSASVS